MQLNATHLFELPFRGFHNAESWWTAYFTMLVLWGSAHGKPVVLPSYLSDLNGNLTEASTVSFSGATHSDLVADARLHGEPFGITDWPNEFLHLRPDVTFLRSLEDRKVLFVETKTIGASIRGNVDLYANLAAFLRCQGWSVEFYYLLSVGHEEAEDWPLLATASASIIKWEDVFGVAEKSPFGCLLGELLSKYRG
jgi:hypothetical protein